MPGDLLAAYTHDGASTNSFIEDDTGNGHGFAIGSSQANSQRVAGKTGFGLSQSIADGGGFGPAAFGLTDQRSLMLNFFQTTGGLTAWAWEWFVPTEFSGAWGILWLSDQIHVQVRNSSTVERASVAVPTLNQWHNICATFDMSTIRLYLDGALVATKPLTGPIRTDTVIKALDQAGTSLVIDDVRVWDGCLTDEEVAAWAPLSADQTPAPATTPGRLKYESAPGVWTPVPLKTETGSPLVVKTETGPGTWEALP